MSLVEKWVSRLVTGSMSLLLAMSSTGCKLAWWAKTGPTLKTEVAHVGYMSRYPRLKAPMGGAGKVPLQRVIARLMRLEVLNEIPPPGLPSAEVEILDDTSIADVIGQVERLAGWIYDPEKKAFYEGAASHSIDEPDAFGRPAGSAHASLQARSMIAIGVRFRRVNASVSFDPSSIGVGGVGTVVWFSIPDGVKANPHNESERSFFDQVTDTGSGRTFSTQRKVATSGVKVEGMAARLPGGLFRLDAQLEVSSFVGSSADRAVVAIPLQVDGKRGEWQRVYSLQGGDVTARVAFERFGLVMGATGEAIEVCVRVE